MIAISEMEKSDFDNLQFGVDKVGFAEYNHNCENMKCDFVRTKRKRQRGYEERIHTGL